MFFDNGGTSLIFPGAATDIAWVFRTDMKLLNLLSLLLSTSRPNSLSILHKVSKLLSSNSSWTLPTLRIIVFVTGVPR